MIISSIDNTKIEIEDKTRDYIINFILNGQERINERINKETKMQEKASYCLNCPTKPCRTGCPLGNDIPSFIKKIKEENYEEAYNILLETTVLQPICGRICPHMKQCRGKCVRGIKGEPVEIGELEAFVGDMAIQKKWNINKLEEKTNKKIAIVGGGPAGLTAAAFLRRKGHKITIYEKHNELGGLLSHGIPEFRLPRNILKETIQKILNLGIEVKYNSSLGKDITLDELKKEYDVVLLTFGANISAKMGIEGEELEGVYGGNELLENNNHPDYNGKIVVVNGGGNTAMDTSRTINKMGAKKVYVVYRRAREQMPAEQKEIDDAIKEGIEFLFQNNIVKIIGDKYVEKIECIKTQLIQAEGETRLKPVNIEGSNYEIPVDYVVMAVGAKPEEEILKTLNLKTNKWGYIETDDNNRTSDEKVFCAGDISGEKSTVAWAARSGRNAAENIDKYLEKEN